MKITRSDGERLVIVDFPWVMAAGLTFLAVGFVIQTAVGYKHTHVINEDGWVGCGVSALFLLCAAYITKRSVFTFDLVRRQLEWSAASLFGRQGGIVPFHEIECARIATVSDNRGRPEYRVLLSLPDSELPLANMYWRGSEQTYRKVCDTINRAIGKSPAG
jgi:hypothetical protein